MQLAQGLWCGSPAFDSPGEGAVLLGKGDKAGGRGGMRWQMSPVRLLWAGAAPGLGLPVTNSYSFGCPGTQIRVLLGSWFIGHNSLVHRVFFSGWSGGILVEPGSENLESVLTTGQSGNPQSP